MSNLPTLKIEMLPIDALHEYEGNARQHGETDVAAIKVSIEKFGFNDPIGIWRDNIIVEGHGRLMAAKDLGMTEVPVIRLDHLTDEERRAYALAHNKTAELSGWHPGKLDLELAGIKEIDMSALGFKPITIQHETGEEDQDVEVPDEPQAQVGDLFLLGRHRLLCGNSTDPEVVERLMNGQKADVIYTDPPYGMDLDPDYSSMQSKLNTKAERQLSGTNYAPGKVDAFNPKMIEAVLNINARETFLFGADYYAELLPNRNAGSWIVWDKRTNEDEHESEVALDRGYGSAFELCWSRRKHKREIARVKWFGLFGLEKEHDRKRVHPTQKPVILAKWFIERYSERGEIVLDMFGGSGSTLLACEQLDRKCYMIEIDPFYCDVIIARWEALTGLKAERIN